MITIPTGDLVGILSDAIPFADPDKKVKLTHCVRLEWSSYQLHAMATDRYHLGWSTWEPDDEPIEDHQPDMMTEWGSGDDEWGLTIGLDDAKHLVKVFELSGKGVYYVPLTVEYLGTGAVRIQRSRESGHSAISTTVKEATFARFPDIRGLLAGKDTIAPAAGFNLSAKRLANFAKVRPRGPMEVRFTGPDSLVLVSIGDRFVGAIQPAREGERIAAVPAPDPASEPGPEAGGADE